jgi:UDP-N-acetylmuramoylalanine--D-glutamate ligase
VIIIAGGYDKNIPFDEFGEKITQKAKAAILIGKTASKIASSIRNTQVETVASLSEAVNLAKQLATGSDVVLLSPACASYDMFDNFEHRGREFCRLVRETSG